MPASFRTFNSPGGQTVNGVSYLFDTDSGIFRPVYKSDLASNLSLSGNLNFDSTTTNALLSGISGQLATVPDTPAWVTGQLTTNPAGGSTVSNDTISGSFGLALGANTSRHSFFIQNLHTGNLLVRFSASYPTSSNFNVLLKGGSTQNDGLGATYASEPTTYFGPVSVTGQGGAPVSYIAWET